MLGGAAAAKVEGVGLVWAMGCPLVSVVVVVLVLVDVGFVC